MAIIEGGDELAMCARVHNLLGDDMDALQELLRAYHLAEKRRRSDMAHRSTDAQRVSATVPR